MGQKIHPTGFRLSVTRDWSSRWFANSKAFPGMLREDIAVRDYIRKKLAHASVGRVVIERPAKNARVTVHSARPGVVIGKKGEDIELLKRDLQNRMGVPVHVSIEEIRKPEIDAQLIADSISQQLEKRIMFRRAMKRAMQNAMRLGAQGIKIMSSGRLNGAEIARTEWYREGRVPLHTLRAQIDYGFSEAKTTYGVIGIKVWVFKGETTGREETVTPPAPQERQDEPAKRPKRSVRASSSAADGETKPAASKMQKKSEAAQSEVKPGQDSPKPTAKRVRKTAAGQPVAGKGAKE
ncbi:30S ribosomal protein S3 [Sulfuricystis multivorans]|uniref:30S ribosomal protein S3 n=1 Tax=Sulfuricystis multivorans TaxID=2211108 RepID=UPI000F846281|nr:30S ribosomal protein S3 [Sulfuricystis multivorans]